MKRFKLSRWLGDQKVRDALRARRARTMDRASNRFLADADRRFLEHWFYK